MGAYADINYSSSTQMDVMTLVFQACAFLLTIMCFYNMLAETNLVKRAMFSKLAREFSTPLFLAGLYFVFILVSSSSSSLCLCVCACACMNAS